MGSDFPFPGWGVVTAARNLGKEQSDQKQPQVQAGNLNSAEGGQFKESKTQTSLDWLDLATPQKPSPSPKKSYADVITNSGAHER